MDNDILFSIIVPIYNAEKYLEECIESVLNQSFQNFELVLVDDGSKDNSRAICEKYLQENPDKVVFYTKENEGQFLTRQKGVELSKGEYIVFLDSDDILRTDALEIINKKIEVEKYDLIIYGISTQPDFRKEFNKIDLEEDTLIEKTEIHKLILDGYSMNSMCNKCVKRECIINVKENSEIKHVRYGEDLIYFIFILEGIEKITYINKNLYYYRQNEESVTHSIDDCYIQSVIYSGNFLREYSESWFLDDEIIIKRTANSCGEVVRNILKSKIKWNKKKKYIKQLVYSDFFESSMKNVTLSGLTLKRQLLLIAVHFCRFVKIF